MMRSMFSGVSGLRVHQTKMDVIANNISNVNTVGFKSSRVTFNEIFAQTVSGASGANDTTGRGGVNPMQIGLGASVASIDLSMTTGAAQRTDNPYDLMIQGDGFFIVGDNSGKYFTRAGAFTLDEAGNLVNPSGLKVYGWQRTTDLDTAQYKIQKGAVTPIEIKPDMRNSPPKTTTRIEFEGNLNAVNDNEHTSTISFYDSIGNRWTASVTFTLKETSTVNGKEVTVWDYEVNPEAYVGSDSENPHTLKMDPTTGTISFNTDGKVEAVDGAGLITNTKSINVKVEPEDDFQPAITFGNSATNNIIIDFDGLTQFGDENTNAKSDTKDGHAAGTLNGISVGTDGKVTGRYSNGDLVLLAQIAVARFKNPAGLEKFGDNLYVPTSNSGEFDGIGEEVQQSGGKMLGGVLEMSNVDLSQEFTEMITTQRGFQANSRIITTSDDMLQELVNLKR